MHRQGKKEPRSKGTREVMEWDDQMELHALAYTQSSKTQFPFGVASGLNHQETGEAADKSSSDSATW